VMIALQPLCRMRLAKFLPILLLQSHLYISPRHFPAEAVREV